MSKIIIAGGDSFVYGSELADCTPTQHSWDTFAAKLSGGYEYICTAKPGYGNDSIARNIIKSCEQNKNQIKQIGILVSWTFVGRYEFRFSYNTGNRESPWYVINPWTVEDDHNKISSEFVSKDPLILQAHIKEVTRAKDLGIQDFARNFYKHVGTTEYWEVYSSIKEIVYLQNYLKINGIPYMFTCADNGILYNYTCDHADDTIRSLTSQIDFNHWFWFPAGYGPDQTTTPRGFYQWAVENKYPIGTTHPLEIAHQVATDIMQEKFNELVTQYL